jgi:hypothetical protein
MTAIELPTGIEAGAITLLGNEEILAKSIEVARLWVENQGPGTFIIRPDRLASPEMFGMMLADCARHAARAFSDDLGITETEAMDRIWEGLDNERDDPTGEMATVEKLGKPN